MSTLSAKLRKVRDLLGSIDQTDFKDLSQPDLNDASNTFRRLRTDIETIGRFFAESKKDA